MPVFDGDEAGPDRFESTIEAVERLRRALRDEHSLLTQYKMIAWGRVFTPIQVTTESHVRHREPGECLRAIIWSIVSKLTCMAKLRRVFLEADQWSATGQLGFCTFASIW